MDITVSAFAPTRNNHLSCLHIQTLRSFNGAKPSKQITVDDNQQFIVRPFTKAKFVLSILSTFREHNEDASTWNKNPQE